jgi:hypothetical protein
MEIEAHIIKTPPRMLHEQTSVSVQFTGCGFQYDLLLAHVECIFMQKS